VKPTTPFVIGSQLVACFSRVGISGWITERVEAELMAGRLLMTGQWVPASNSWSGDSVQIVPGSAARHEALFVRPASHDVMQSY
jgi:hypothetical protein